MDLRKRGSGFLKGKRGSGNRTDTHNARIYACRSVAANRCEWLQTELFSLSTAHHNYRRSAIVKARGVARGDLPILLKGWSYLGESFRTCFWPWLLLMVADAPPPLA